MQHLSGDRRRDIPPPLFLYRAERKRPSGHRKIPLFVLPVMPDVLDIVVVLQHIDELLHILQVALIGEGDVVLGLLPQGFQRFFDCCFQSNKLLTVTH